MQLCDTCGFVLNESDFKCANCAAPIPDREAPIEQIQARTPIEKTTPKITAIVPVYNRPEQVQTCIQHILNQTESVDELIVIDDGATELSARFRPKFRQMDHRAMLECLPISGCAGHSSRPCARKSAKVI